MAVRCKRCEADPRPAMFGNDRMCAFDHNGDFTPNNWNCATITALLDRNDGVYYGSDETLHLVRADMPGGETDGWIVLTRYKSRGHTSSAVHVGDFWPAQPLTLALAEAAIEREKEG